MRVAQKVLDSVVFIGTAKSGRFVPYGTGFIGTQEYEDLAWQFLITAKHVLDDIPGDEIYIRANRHDGTAISFPTKKIGITPSDAAVDVAMVPVVLDPTVFDFVVLPLNRDIWNHRKSYLWEYGPGDEVSIVGLYTSHYGETKNIPVVRIGHIAAMPSASEKVRTDRGFATGYLIGTHSIAGHSGSPVFVNVPPIRIKDKQPQFLNDPDMYILIGVLIGHHQIETKEDEIIVPEVQLSEAEAKSWKPSEPGKIEQRRTGFAAVIPIEVIFDLLETPPMQAELKNAVEAYRKDSGFVADSGRLRPVAREEASFPPTDENPNHRESFTALLNEAARKPPQAD